SARQLRPPHPPMPTPHQPAQRVSALPRLLPPANVPPCGEMGKAAGVTARQVRSVMRQWGSQVPWWRVIKADGTSHDYERAKAKWEAEGLVLRGRAVRMDLCGLDHRDLENLARK